MNDYNELVKSGISDELLAAYIDGNTTESENQLIENSLKGDSILSDAYDIAHDSVSFGSNFDWELHKGDFGFWELGLPPAITDDMTISSGNDMQLNSMDSSTDNTLSVPSLYADCDDTSDMHENYEF